jgi:hypothetical protein
VGRSLVDQEPGPSRGSVSVADTGRVRLGLRHSGLGGCIHAVLLGGVGLGCGAAYSGSGSLQVTAIRRAGDRTMRQDRGAADPYFLEAILLVAKEQTACANKTASSPRSCWFAIQRNSLD